jgi:hypothetical protein
VGTWQDPDLGRPIAAPLERCAELLGVPLAAIREAADHVQPYLRADRGQGLEPDPAGAAAATARRWSGPRRLPHPPSPPGPQDPEPVTAEAGHCWLPLRDPTVQASQVVVSREPNDGSPVVRSCS